MVMFSTPVKKLLQKSKAILAPPDTTVVKASKLMARKNTGAVMVTDGERLVGIFTERDAVFRVIAKGLDPAVTTLSEVMTPDPKTVEPDRSYGYALVMMHDNGFRHVPVVENGVPIGIVSGRNALDPELEEFVFETHRRSSLT